MVGGVVLLSLLTDINAFLIYTYLLITTVIRRHQIFLGGSSDENEKVLGKFLARL